MADTKTTAETARSPIDGTESVRLATSGANWKATIAAIFGTTTGVTDQITVVGTLTAGGIPRTLLTGLGTGVATALGVNIGSAGAPVLFNGAGGTPTSLTGTNITGTASGLTAGNVTTNANLTGPITSSGNATSIAAQTGTGTTFAMSASPTFTGTVGVTNLTATGIITLGAGPAIISSPTAAIFQHGAADVASGAVAQFIRAQSNTGASTTGPNFTWQGTTGTTAGGSLIFQVAATTSYATALTIASDKTATFASSVAMTGLNAGAGNIANTGTSNYIGTISSFFFAAHSSGVVELCGAGLTGSGFGRLQFGGTTSSFPAIKRNSAALNFRVADDTADAAITAAAITGSGLISSTSPTAGVGYATGAGGTVTQATNKSTSVTLNTVTGQITMNNANLAGQTEVSFTLTNSAIAATDVVLVSIASGATANSYIVGVAATAAGSCVIQLGNVTLATTLGEAVVLNFAVIKGVTS